ncbi:MAG: VWA domain-containing protein [Planctomycetota bacterium]|nr:VWA domain-containing protein [Planctomycetota bacterium]
MNFSNPEAFWLLLLALPLIALYLVKKRRRRATVASFVLWERAVAGLSVAARRQWLGRLASLLLHLGVLLCTILALAGPVPAADGRGRDIFLVLDVSASMQAREEGARLTRFERAIEGLHRAAASAGARDRTCLVICAEMPSVPAPLGTEPQEIVTRLERLRTLKPRDAGADLTAAIDLVERLRAADRLLQGEPDRDAFIVVASDDPAAATMSPPPSNAAVIAINACPGADNAGIVRVSAQWISKETVSVFYRLVWFGKGPRDLELTAYFEPDPAVRDDPAPRTEVARIKTHADKEGKIEGVFEFSAASAGRIEFALSPRDALDADNSAALHLRTGPPRPRIVLAASDVPPSPGRDGLSDRQYAAAALAALGNAIDRERSVVVSPELVAGFRDNAGSLANEDTVVIVCSPSPGLGGKRLRMPEMKGTWRVLTFGACLDAPDEGRSDLREISPPAGSLVWNELHAITKGVDLSGISVSSTMALRPDGAETTLAGSGDLAAAVAGSKGGGKYVWFGFALQETNMAGQPSFPLLVRNSIDWLCGIEAGARSVAFSFPLSECDLRTAATAAVSSPTALPPSPAPGVESGALAAAFAVAAALLALFEWAIFCREAERFS